MVLRKRTHGPPDGDENERGDGDGEKLERKKRRKEKLKRKKKGKTRGVGNGRDLAIVNAKRSWAHQCSSREAGIGWRPKVRQRSAASHR